MSLIDEVKTKIDAKNYFNSLSQNNYMRVLDTPHAFGLPFGKDIMPQSLARQADFQRAIEEIIQKTYYLCDVSSLNSPDPEWGKVILNAMDIALTQKMGRTKSPQFRFLFGHNVAPADDFEDFKAALIRLVQARAQYWEIMPEIWVSLYYRLEKGAVDYCAELISLVSKKIIGRNIIGSNDGADVTWNHSKIIAVDGAEALAGGHNLNMDLFKNYPPVHDISAVFHGYAARSAQLYLDELWQVGNDLLTKSSLDMKTLQWVNRDKEPNVPVDPLDSTEGAAYMEQRIQALMKLHQSTHNKAEITSSLLLDAALTSSSKDDIAELEQPLFGESKPYTDYQYLSEYKLADRILCLGKYWTGPVATTDHKNASDIMKETLIKGAKKIIRMSQQDIMSAWVSNWSDHKVGQWLLEALLANPELEIQLVVSPLDAAAGASGDQYSFGSGAVRTMEILQYYMLHDAKTDQPFDDSDGKRANALSRIKVAPLCFTDITEDQSIEGVNYKWPDADKSAYTATLKEPPLSVEPSKGGDLHSIIMTVIHGSGKILPKVAPAPGNHAKLTIIDDELYVIGSDNMYPSDLAEVDFMVEGTEAVQALLESYWHPLWKYSSPYAIEVVL